MAYYTLVASLPHLPPHFDVKRPPITRLALEKRLQMLSGDDAARLRRFWDFLLWDRQPMDRTDEQVVRDYERIRSEMNHPLSLRLIQLRIDVRTIVGALRRRRSGKAPPIGVGRLTEPIRRRWYDPHFGLENQFPWIEEFSHRLEAGDAVDAERVLFEFTWRNWSRLAESFYFSFEAVLLYLARWEIVDRWTSRDLETGRVRFDSLVRETLGNHACITF